MAVVPRAGKVTDEVTAQDAPDVAWDEDELLLVGVVVGDCSVVLDVEGLEVVDELDVELDVLLSAPVDVLVVLLPLAVAAVVDLAWCGSAASAANSPTPASEPAATQPVAFRLRRSQLSRHEGVVMTPSKTVRPQSRLCAPSTRLYRFLGAR